MNRVRDVALEPPEPPVSGQVERQESAAAGRPCQRRQARTQREAREKPSQA